MSFLFRALFVGFLGLQLTFTLAQPTLFDHGELIKRTPSTTGEFYQTNAQRLAAGLPPMAPKRRHFAPTKVGIAARAPSPTAMSGGNVRVARASDNSLVGYLYISNLAKTVSVSARSWGPMSFGFTYFDSATPFELRIADDKAYPYLGVAATSFSRTSSAAGYFVRTNSASEYGPPKVVGHSNTGLSSPPESESFLWKFNPSTNEITGTFVNTDRTTLDTYFYFNPGTTEMLMSGNPALSSGFVSYTKVRLFWEMPGQ